MREYYGEIRFAERITGRMRFLDDTTARSNHNQWCTNCKAQHSFCTPKNDKLCPTCYYATHRIDGKELTEMEKLRVKYWGYLYCVEDDEYVSDKFPEHDILS